MRRYGSFQYGATQYGFGPVDARYADTILFTDDVRWRHIQKIYWTDTVQFSERIDTAVLTVARYSDTIQFTSDIRLKYVRMDYSTVIQFSEDFRPKVVVIARYADNVLFTEALKNFKLVKQTYMTDYLVISSRIYMRHNWEPMPNPEDEIWVPNVSETDIWIPRVSPADIWTPREQNNG